jgi:hypothetical protein
MAHASADSSTPRLAAPLSLKAFLLATFVPLVLCSACAPDAWRPESPYDGFIDQVQKKCFDQPIGRKTIGPDLLPYSGQPDTAFLDETSRFYNGKIRQDAYVNWLVGFYGARPDSPGITCILGLMPPRALDPLQPPDIVPPNPPRGSR